MTVLIFEDEANQRLTLEDLIKDMGYNPIAFARPSQCLQYLQEGNEKPVLAILDIRMQDGVLANNIIAEEKERGFTKATAGLDLARKIKELYPMPVIFQTGYPEQFKHAIDILPSAFLKKGVDLRENLKQAIQLALAKFNLSEYAERSEPPYKTKKICINVSWSQPIRPQVYSSKVVLDLDDIYYFSSENGGVKVYTDSDNAPEPLMVKMPVKDFYELLKTHCEKNEIDFTFEQCFRSRYVNMNRIFAFENNGIFFGKKDNLYCTINANFYARLTRLFGE